MGFQLGWLTLAAEEPEVSCWQLGSMSGWGWILLLLLKAMRQAATSMNVSLLCFWRPGEGCSYSRWSPELSPPLGKDPRQHNQGSGPSDNG